MVNTFKTMPVRLHGRNQPPAALTATDASLEAERKAHQSWIPNGRAGANALNTGLPEITWNTNAVGFQLQCAASLAPAIAWQPVTIGIVTTGSWHHDLVPDAAAAPYRFYRLCKP